MENTPRDRDIRAALHSRLLALHGADPNCRVVDELSILRGHCRADVAVINGRLDAYEIKSARDTLDRLPRQAEAYGRVFDRVTVICADRHLEGARRCIPSWWGIEVAQGTADEVRLTSDRPGRANPAPDPDAIVQLLWRGETLGALEALELAAGLRSKPRRVLWGVLAAAVPVGELRALVRRQLCAREDWPTARPPL